MATSEGTGAKRTVDNEVTHSRSPLLVRPATPRDWAALVGTWDEALFPTHDFVSAADLAEIRARLPEYFAAVELWVCEVGGVPKGFVGLAGDKIEMLFVGERGRGIGTRLLDFATSERGARRVDVNEQNHRAVEFYRKRGFEVCGRSEKDGDGRDYPLLNMELRSTSRGIGRNRNK